MNLVEIWRLCEELTLNESTIDGYLEEAAENYRSGQMPLPLYLATVTSLLTNFCGSNASLRANRTLRDVRNFLRDPDVRNEAASLAEFWYFIEGIDIRLDKSVKQDFDVFARFVNDMIVLSTEAANGPLHAILGTTRVCALSDIIVDYVASTYLKARLHGEDDRRFDKDLLDRVQERLEGRSFSHSSTS
ncbi:hypothetical protein [Rhizobium grahamii]|uniref:Uncharacterized protein n=1 Tax=Rhizobium grahamii TaxID=1120045 RepID=A0A370KH29_9HYPH|nr:hypothetical protein [Rhizobium grahamii]RDJ04232.1 hypothetical protein B5K06_27600 [Rhizobium grahamii]